MEKRIRAKDELYDVSMLRGYGCKNDGYGELLPSFSIQLAEVLNLTASNKLLDVGSGIGFLCFDLACISGCSVKGIEIRRDIFLKSVQIAKHVAERMKLDVSFVYGDATGDSFHFKNMDVIVCCNTLWSDENNYRYTTSLPSILQFSLSRHLLSYHHLILNQSPCLYLIHSYLSNQVIAKIIRADEARHTSGGA